MSRGHETLHDTSLESLPTPEVRQTDWGRFKAGSYVGGDGARALDESAQDVLIVERPDDEGGGSEWSSRDSAPRAAPPTPASDSFAHETPAIGATGDALLRTSPFLQDLLGRIVHLERSREEQAMVVHRMGADVEQLRGDVDRLLRGREQPGHELVRRLSEQVESLSGNVSHLMHVQASQQSPTFSRAETGPAFRSRSVSPTEPLRRPVNIVPPQLSPALVDIPPRNVPSPSYSPVLETNPGSNQKLTWEAAGLPSGVAKAAVQCGFGDAPSKISASAITYLMRDADIVAQAPAVRDRLATTVLPSMAFLQQPKPSQEPSIRVLVVSATIEQASQLHRWYTSLNVRASISAANIDLPTELGNLNSRLPDVLIGLPQRLLDLLALRALPLHDLRLLVVDEADNLVARNLSDFVLSLVSILPPCSKSSGRQTAVLSSTVPNSVLVFASNLHLREPVRVLAKRETVASGGEQAPSVRGIRHHYLWCAMAAKTQTAAWKQEAICDLCEDTGFRTAVVWCASIESVEAVNRALVGRGLDSNSLHENSSPAAREAILSHFNGGQASKKILVLSEALVRSFNELQNVSLVVNFSLPVIEDYVHRVSCAASSGYSRPGVAVSIICNEPETQLIRQCEQFYRLQIAELPPYLTNLN